MELAQAVDLMMVHAKIIYILMIFCQCFLNKIENMFSVFLWSFSINLLAFYHEYCSMIGYTHYLFCDR